MPMEKISPKIYEEASAPILKVIQEATESLEGCVYKLDYDPILDALIAAKKRGVSVTLFVEASPYQHAGSNQTTTNILALEKSGIKVIKNLKTQKESQLHAKFLLADGKKLLLTTMNWDQESFLGSTSWHQIPPQGDAPTRDVALLLEDPVLIEEASQAIKWAKTGEILKTPSHVSLNFGPLSSTRDYIMQALMTAKKSLQIWQQSVQDDQIIDALIKLQEGGVQVSLVMTHDPFNASLKGKEDGNLPNLHRLTKAGVKIYRLPSFSFPYIHMKGAIIDGERFLFTSSNFYPKSLDNGFEVSYNLDDIEAVKALLVVFEKDVHSGQLFKLN